MKIYTDLVEFTPIHMSVNELFYSLFKESYHAHYLNELSLEYKLFEEAVNHPRVFFKHPNTDDAIYNDVHREEFSHNDRLATFDLKGMPEHNYLIISEVEPVGIGEGHYIYYYVPKIGIMDVLYRKHIIDTYLQDNP